MSINKLKEIKNKLDFACKKGDLDGISSISAELGDVIERMQSSTSSKIVKDTNIYDFIVKKK